MGQALDEILAHLATLPESQKVEMLETARAAAGDIKWTPNEGPQTEAYYTEAFLTLYGGAAGGGKSDLGLGLAFNEHQRTLVYRKQYTDLTGLTDRAKEIKGNNKGYNGSSPPRLTIDDRRLIDFGAAKSSKLMQTNQGQPHDLIYVDEAAQLAEAEIRLMFGWCRSKDPDQRCRIVLGSNPPLSDEGLWMNTMFAAWLDPRFPNPAEPGELRWYISDQYGLDAMVPGPGVYEFDGEGYPVPSGKDQFDDDAFIARSRTFIPARLADNPYLARTDYKSTLDSLPEPLRSALRDGDFVNSRQDHDTQLIPSEWISEAQARWTREGGTKRPMCAMGVDVAGGGSDDNVIAARHDGWYDELKVRPGRGAGVGTEIAGWIVEHRRNQADVIIDMGGGYGARVFEPLQLNLDTTTTKAVYGWKGADSSVVHTAVGNQGFYNRRAEGYYRLYEALDPNQPGGSPITLPPDPVLYGELCSIRKDKRWVDQRVIKLEPKVDLVQRIGKSPDKADAVMMAWQYGPKATTYFKAWQSARGTGQPVVNTSKRSARRLRR